MLRDEDVRIGVSLHPHMHPVIEQLQREMEESLRGLDARQTQLRTADDPARWSIQEIMEHLFLTYEATCGVFETRIAKKTPTKAKPLLQQRVAHLVMLRLGRFPRGRKSPASVAPKPGEPAVSGEILAYRAGELLTRFDERAMDAERLFKGKRAISHQVLGPLSVAQWRQFQLVHGKHHLKQIRAIRAAKEA